MWKEGVLNKVLSPQDWQHYTSRQEADHSPSRLRSANTNWYT